MLENLTELIHKFGGKETDKLLTNLVSDKQSVLLEMYVIPKLHKIPVSSRPITPSHKWLTCLQSSKMAS